MEIVAQPDIDDHTNELSSMIKHLISLPIILPAYVVGAVIVAILERRKVPFRDVLFLSAIVWRASMVFWFILGLVLYRILC